MKTQTLFLLLLNTLLLSACLSNGSSVSSSNRNDDELFEKVNVAAASQGAISSSDSRPTQAINLIDEKTTTTFLTINGEPVVVRFENLEEIFEIKLTRISAPADYSSAPDILIEFSEDGVNYIDSTITDELSEALLRCNAINRNNEVIMCAMNYGEEMQYIRITSQNAKTYNLIELSAIAHRPLL